MGRASKPDRTAGQPGRIRRWRRISIRHRFVVVTSLGLLLFVAAIGTAAYLVSRSSLEDQLNHSLRQEFDQIARSVRSHSSYVVTGPCQYAAAPACARIVDRRSRSVAVDGITSKIPIPPGSGAVAAGTQPAFLYDSTYARQPIRQFVGQLRPGQALIVAETSTDLHTDLRDLNIALAVVAVVGLLLLILLTWLLTRINLAPVGELVSSSRQIAARRDPTMRLDASGEDELSEIAAAFNAVLEQLDTLVDAQRRFVADASHEMRTPLASLRMNVDLMTRWDKLSEEQRTATVRSLDTKVQQMVTIVNGLIDLAREEAEPPHWEQIELDELVGECVTHARENWPQALFVTDLKPCTIVGAPRPLAAALTSVLDNAAKFAADAGQIEVAVHDGVVTVRDHGPGIPADDRERIFHRFYRSQNTRAVIGSGLGLAIAHEAVALHGGTITADAGTDGNGTLITMTFAPDPAGPARWSQYRRAPAGLEPGAASH